MLETSRKFRNPLIYRSSYSVPSKIFLLGEYAVLKGGTAVVATAEPRFELAVLAEANSNSFHENSPAGKLLDRVQADLDLDVDFKFFDPHSGVGGMGGSSAEFALLFQALSDLGLLPNGVDVWKTYRDLTASSGISPSGADLMAQIRGGVQAFSFREEYLLSPFEIPDLSEMGLLIFGASHQKMRKVRTHEHLSSISCLLTAQIYGDLADLSNKALSATGTELAVLTKSYAEILNKCDLELEASTLDRLAFEGHADVLSAKGTGALLADGMMVWLKPGVDPFEILQFALDRDLKLLASNFPGVGSPVGVSGL